MCEDVSFTEERPQSVIVVSSVINIMRWKERPALVDNRFVVIKVRAVKTFSRDVFLRLPIGSNASMSPFSMTIDLQRYSRVINMAALPRIFLCSCCRNSWRTSQKGPLYSRTERMCLSYFVSLILWGQPSKLVLRKPGILLISKNVRGTRLFQVRSSVKYTTIF